MHNRTYHPSPFMRLGAEEFVNARGQRVVPAARSDSTALFLIPSDVARLLGTQEIDTTRLSDTTLQSLVRRGLITDDTHATRSAHYEKMHIAANDRSTRSFTLFPTSYCNMGCEYCGQEHRKQSLNTRHRLAVLGRIRNVAQSEGLQRINLGWFGGEPLMAYNTIREMSRQIISFCSESSVSYTASIVTNGALLTARKLDTLVNQCAVTRFNITIDGPEGVHDAHRPLKSGAKSYRRLTSLLAEATQNPELDSASFVLRTNIDVENCDYIDEYLKEMADLGFSGKRNVIFQLVPIHSWGNDVEKRRVGRDKYLRREVEWLALMQRLGLQTTLLPGGVRAKTCSAVGPGSEVILTDGNVFSCTEQPLVPSLESESRLAHVDNLQLGDLRPAGAYDSWNDSVASGGIPCSTCWLLPACGGSCPKLWAEGEVPCPSIKFNITDRLSLAAKEYGLQPIGAFTPDGD
ncbi:radical SAM protein [Streptomyces sp. NPDC052040]|uniref:radical SAM protein n=1 Tax=Streptomyces sp. NPDC052040 TaxID=3365682 RepID=UPI0037D04A11